MVSSTQFSHNATFTGRQKLWNPSQILGIINTDPGYQCITCIGHAPSKGRRCRNPIRSDNVNFITNTLDEIAYLDPNSPAVMSRLRAIAGPALCVRYHQGQSASIVMQWQRKIQQVELKPQIREQKPSQSIGASKNQDYRHGQKQTISELQEQLREMREFLAQLRGERYERPDVQATKQRQEEERKRKEREEREREDRRMEEERLEKERLEKERLEKERVQKEREESKRREQAAHNERIRQRAQKLRQEREREKREAEKREQEEWTRAWTKYQERWADFRTPPSREGNVRDAIPWPVKSGSCRDVVASNVEEFLKRAVARDTNPSRLLRRECKKWHPDMIDRLLRGTQLTDVDEMMIQMICRVVTGLLNDSAGRQSELFD